MNGTEYTRVFRALSDEKRVRVLELLCKGEQCACVLLADLDISQPTLSHHMKILCESGLVTGRRVGHWNYYTINGEGCKHAGGLLDAIANHDMERWLRTARRLHRIFHPFRPAQISARSTGSCDCVSPTEGRQQIF